MYSNNMSSSITSKRQFLDPISGGCRLVLLHFSQPNTKIRIIDHTIQLVNDTYYERVVNRKIYGDSRNDLCALYPLIVRFIELYLIEKKQINVELNEEKEVLKNKCYKSLIEFAEFIILGLEKLEKTYDYDNAVFTIKYYSNLIRSGIDGTYNQNLLPKHLLEPTNNNLLDVSKIKTLWNDSTIIILVDLLKNCFRAHFENDTKMIKVYNVAINEMLNTRDVEFREIISMIDKT